MPSELGSIDARGRPVVRVKLAKGDIDFLAVVDAGFNGELFIAAVDARPLGLQSIGVRSSAEVAGGVRQQVEETLAMISWMGRERRVEVLLGLAPNQPRPADEPIALIGSRMLTPHLLLIDYSVGTVEVEAQV